jgi:hypothetical protein
MYWFCLFLRFWYFILELFRQCGIFCFSFYSYLGVTKGSGLHAAYETLHKSFIPSGAPVSTTNDCSLGDQSNQHADKHVESPLTYSNIQITLDRLDSCTSDRHHNQSAWHSSYNGKIFILYSFYNQASTLTLVRLLGTSENWCRTSRFCITVVRLFGTSENWRRTSRFCITVVRRDKWKNPQMCRYEGQIYFHWYKILGLLYKRALFDLQLIHNLFWLKLK